MNRGSKLLITTKISIPNSKVAYKDTQYTKKYPSTTTVQEPLNQVLHKNKMPLNAQMIQLMMAIVGDQCY